MLKKRNRQCRDVQKKIYVQNRKIIIGTMAYETVQIRYATCAVFLLYREMFLLNNYADEQFTKN